MSDNRTLGWKGLAVFQCLKCLVSSLQGLGDVGVAVSHMLRQFYQRYPSTRKLAQRLGVSHTAIANKLKQYGIGK